MQRKRLLSIVLVAALSIGIFSGCKKTAETPQDSKTTAGTTEGTKTETKPAEVITINWMPQNDKPMDENSPVTAALEKRFNVKLNYIYIEKNKDELLNVRIASGDIPDVMTLTPDERYRTFIDQGILAEIPEDLLKKQAPNLYSLVNKNAAESGFSNVWEFVKEKGKIYGIPSLSIDGMYSYPTLWRDDWAKNVGVNKVPETLQEAEDLFYKYVKNDPDKNGKNDTYAFSTTMIPVIFGAYLTDPSDKVYWNIVDGKAVASVARPEAKEVYKLLAKWYKDGLIDPEFITGESKGQYWGSSVVFQNGRIGATNIGMGYHVNPPNPDLPEDKGAINYQNFKSLQPNGSFAYGQGLKGPSGKVGKTQIWGALSGRNMVMGKNVDQKKMEKILEITEASVSNFDDFMLVSRGIKDVTYKEEKVGSSVYYTIIGQAADPNTTKVIGTESSGVGYSTANNYEFRKKLDVFRYKFLDQYCKFGAEFVNPIIATLPSQAQFLSGINKQMAQNHVEYITGKLSVDEWEKKLDELNKAGLIQLTKEANDWYTLRRK